MVKNTPFIQKLDLLGLTVSGEFLNGEDYSVEYTTRVYSEFLKWHLRKF